MTGNKVLMINAILNEYINDLHSGAKYFKEIYGLGNYLVKKNKGEIPRELRDLKLQIRGYTFHGIGCVFFMKNYSVECSFFKENILGITIGSFKDYIDGKYRKSYHDSELLEALKLSKRLIVVDEGWGVKVR